ncbi:MAG TPA: metallophosphoesterase [Thermoplasmata archaeon]|nr:metallophosphoesterase [Thermoplasmata archaeon]
MRVIQDTGGVTKNSEKVVMPQFIFHAVTKGYRLGDRFRVFPGGAVLITPDDVLVVADLHLGCEAVLEEDGLSLPRVQTRKVQEYIYDLVDAVHPSRLVIAGDLKHNFSRNLAQEWNDIVRFIQGLEGRVRLEVVKGNHDNYLGSILREHGVPFVKELSVSGVRVLHGHEGVLDGRPTVMGHVHPSIAVRDSSGTGMKDSCFLFHEEHQLLVLPALSIVAGGVNVLAEENLRRMSPLLSGLDTGSFCPIAFSGRTLLRFPKINEMRNEERV